MSYYIPQKLLPPEPDFSNFTKEELEQLRKVLKKQQDFENELEQSIGGLKKTMTYLIQQNKSNDSSSAQTSSNPTDQVTNSLSSTSSKLHNDKTLNGQFTSLKNISDENAGFFSKLSTSLSISSSSSSLQQHQHHYSNKQLNCFICKTPLTSNENSSVSTYSFRTKLIKWKSTSNSTRPESAPIMQCYDCFNFACERCGNTTSPDLFTFTYSNDNTQQYQLSQSNSFNDTREKRKWRCKICIVKREVAKKSGAWIPGSSEPGESFRKIIDQLTNQLETSIEQTPSTTTKSDNTKESIKRLRIKKFGLVASAASIFSSNIKPDESTNKADKNMHELPQQTIEQTVPTTLLPSSCESPINEIIYLKNNKTSANFFIPIKETTNSPRKTSLDEWRQRRLSKTRQKIFARQFSSSDNNTISENEDHSKQVQVQPVYKRTFRRFSLNQNQKQNENNSTENETNKLEITAVPSKKTSPQGSFKRAKSLISPHDPSQRKFLRTSNENEDSSIIVNRYGVRGDYRQRSRSNEVTLNAKDLNNFIKQQESVDKQIDENLANLAKVILIEHKRSLQMTQTITEDSSISFTPRDSTDSRRDSFSSRQDSSISVNESEMIRQAAKETRKMFMQSCLSDSKRNSLRNSQDWHQRRKDLMKKTKKWSNAVDENAPEDTGSSNCATDESIASNHEFATSVATTNESFANNSLIEEACIEEENFPDNCYMRRRRYTKKFDTNMESDGTVNSYQSSVHINFPESNIQIAIKSTSSANSSSSTTNTSKINFNEIENASCDINNFLQRKTSRKLPEVPKTNLSNSIPLNLNKVDKNSENSTLKDIKSESKNEFEQETTKQEESDYRAQSFSSGGSQKSNKIELAEKPEVKKFRKRSRVKLDETRSKSSSQNNLSKSIDSSDSFKQKNKNEHTRLNCTKSVDLDKYLDKNNSNLVFVNTILTQRSIDYPCIVRKTPKLSDMVRKRLLFQKVSRGATLLGESFSNSMEKEHVPKAPRKIIIRQDNSIEISLARPPKLRRQTFSEDYTATNYGQMSDTNPEQSSNTLTIGKNPSMLSVSSNGNNDRRKTIETCENIFLQSEESTKLRARTPPSNPHRILLYKDKSDKSIRTNGLGMIIIGGQECEDGSLGCFVTLVIKGGPADINSIEVGDQILEFNGHSLIDSTYEEVRTYMNISGDYVQLVVHHNNIRFKMGSASSPLEVSRHFETVPRLCQSSSRRRRNLPPLPTTNANQENPFNFGKKDPDYIVAETLQVPIGSSLLKPILINRGRLLMQIWDNCKDFKLAVTINQANNLPPRSESEQWFTFVSGRVIFEEQTTQNFKTNAILNSNPTWNETFVFDYNESVEEATLEICVHDTQSPSDTRLLRENFIGMIILPLCEANLEDEPRWYELRDKPTRKTSTASVTFKSSSNDSQDSLCEKKKKSFSIFSSKHISRKSALSSRRSSMHNSTDQGNESSPSPTASASKITPVRKLSKAFARLLSFRRNSESALKKNIIQFESEEEELINNIEDQAITSSLKSNRNNQRRHTELLSVNFLLPPVNSNSRKASASSSRKSSNTSVVSIEEDIDSYFSAEQKNQNSPGVGQVPPKSELNKEDIVTGDIKLGFIMSKGQLEITIFEARNLTKLEGSCKDTYVKTYLRTGTHRIQKKKTNVVKNSTEPVFNTKLSYSACNVLGRRIQVVMIWQKAPKLDKNQCIGEAFIQLDHLDLSQQSIGWYKLYKQHIVDSDFYDST